MTRRSEQKMETERKLTKTQRTIKQLEGERDVRKADYVALVRGEYVKGDTGIWCSSYSVWSDAPRRIYSVELCGSRIALVFEEKDARVIKRALEDTYGKDTVEIRYKKKPAESKDNTWGSF